MFMFDRCSCVCVSMLSGHLFVCCLWSCLFECLPVCLSVCFVSLLACLSVCRSFSLPVCSTILSVCMSVCFGQPASQSAAAHAVVNYCSCCCCQPIQTTLLQHVGKRFRLLVIAPTCWKKDFNRQPIETTSLRLDGYLLSCCLRCCPQHVCDLSVCDLCD